MLSYRLADANAPGYRIRYDGIEIGSISKRTDIHMHSHWHWAVDVMPLMEHGGRPPSGDAESFEEALAVFKEAFATWHSALPADLWQRNRQHIQACDRWR
jgi:hypothetical protein